MNKNYLKELGVFGYAPVEPVILAALASGDPLLLVGKAGTGKTFLLNSLSEALGLEHRHYNASLIAFDDLVGFPWPDEKTGGIRYIETPATVWQAESVLIDEINRCKPEHQNRLFSLIQERRIQGLKLEKLRYRWAAMNPPGFEQDGESYSGVEPLDSALADRFAFVVNVSDWADLGEEDQKLITDPRGEGQISRDQCGLAEFIKKAQSKLAEKAKAPPPVVLEYCRAVATTLGQAGLRISPRRVRQLARNLIALECVSALPRERLFRLGLQWSLPQRTGTHQPDDAVIAAAHRTAWDSVALEGDEKWLHEFHLETDLPKKIEHLLTCTNPDIGTVAISQFLATATPHDSAVFAYSLFPALLENPGTVVGDEGLHELGAIAREILHIDLAVTWRDGRKTPYNNPAGGRYKEVPPYLAKLEEAVGKLSAIRRQRGLQLLLHLFFVEDISINDPVATEALLNSCIRRVKKYHETTRTKL
jgi:MoxR-like ATPase